LADRQKKDNAIVAYLRKTWAELKRVRWPTFEQGWAMTKIVLAVTFAMAVFLGALDFFFSWLLGGVIARNILFIILAAVVAIALVGAVYLIGRGEEV